MELRTTSSYLSTSKIWMLFTNVDIIIIIIDRVVCTHLHVIHHELVTKLGPVLSVRHLLVHQAVEDGEAAVRTEMSNKYFQNLQTFHRN